MSAFFVWNPYITDEDECTLQFIMTNGDVTGGVFSDKEYFAKVFREKQLELDISKPVIEPVRACYYSDYRDEDDWQDVWPVVWTVKLNINSNVADVCADQVPWFGTNLAGVTWIKEPGETESIACMVVADFDDVVSLEAAQHEIEQGAWRDAESFAHEGLSQIKFVRSKAQCKYPQLQVCFGAVAPSFFSSGARHAMEIEEICRTHGGTTDYEARMP
jgi:hypothetical protein